jgi:DNA-binding NarL/FixJ family response regulator
LGRVLILDDSDIFRHSLRALLENEPGWQVCGEADNGFDGARLAEELKPDVILLDVSMPGAGVVQTIGLIRAKGSSAAIIVLSLHKSKQLVDALIKAGAAAYVLKSCVDSDLLDALDVIAREGICLSPATEKGRASGA